MIARNVLGKNMNALQTSLQRLSTGFKINSGKDDPAGLIASEMLRSDVTGIKMAIRNTERANMMIATAESALNEVTNLLNDIRGLVTEAANTGAMSWEMIYANQLQVDASLDAIDRIAAQTTFMGQKLLDGSLDFNMVGIDRNNLKGLAVNQVTFGQNAAPAEVVINVRAAAEKAELYFNQPGLAESMILRWGGNYGFDMETFEKGATVAEIAEIVNKRSDGTGVVAEVGSDALAGLLYVSSLGCDNDMIIKAGLEGLNAGNVEIKYLKGSSDGVQVRYEEPLYEGAPAKILVYLQTEAYEAAFANDIDTSWVMKNGQLVPMRDNNALDFTANIEGAQYNNASIYYVDGSLTDPRFYTSDNPTGTPGMPYAYYSDAGNSSQALFGYVEGTGSGGVNNTGYGFGLQPNEYFSVATRAVGSQYNNVNIQFVAAAPGDTFLSGRNAAAYYLEQKDAYGNVLDKTLTIYYNNDGNTTLLDIDEALRLERHLEDGTEVRGTFELRANLNSGRRLTDVNLFAASAGRKYSSNTHNSGGAEGSLFIVMPPNGKMPAAPDIPEQMGVTAKPLADGNYLAHKDAVWDNITFNFTQNKTVPGNNVSVVYDGIAKTLSITTNKDATYDDILTAINGIGWDGGKPSIFNDKNLFWSDAVGNPKVPDVPRLLAATAAPGTVGRSLTPVAQVEGNDLYLWHGDAPGGSIPYFDDWTFEFTKVDSLGKGVTVAAEGKLLRVSYGPIASYTDILNGINDWGTSTLPVGAPHFAWITADGDPFLGTTTAARSTQNVITVGGVDYRLEHDSPAFNGYEIRFVADSNATAPLAEVGRSGSIITVTYNETMASIDNILTQLNGSWGGSRPAGLGDFYWADAAAPLGTGRVTGSLSTAVGGFDTNFVATGNVQFSAAITTGTDNLAGTTLATIDSGKYQAKTNIPVGDSFYLAHTNNEWDKYTFNFARTGTTGGSVNITFDGMNINVTMDDDATYEEILRVLNNPFADPPANTLANWTLIGAGAPANMPHVDHTDADTLLATGLYWVNVQGILTDPAIPNIPTAGLSTNSGVYQPFQYSPDGRSTLVGNGMYLQHTHKSWDNLDIKFASSGVPVGLTPGNVPPITINFDGKMVTVIADTDATYDEILAALNDPHGTGIQKLLDEAHATLIQNPTDAAALAFVARWEGATPGTTAWQGWGDTSGNHPYPVPSQLPLQGDLRWVDGTGFSTTVTTLVPAGSAAFAAPMDLAFSHDDPKWDGYEINFVSIAGTVGVKVGNSGNVLTVTYDAAAGATTLQDIEDALNGPWSGKPPGIGKLTMSSPGGTYAMTDTLNTVPLLVNNNITLSDVTYKSNVAMPIPPLNHVVKSGAVERDITANDIAALFDLDNPLSRGSERAAGLFTVKTTVDNDGTGVIRLYDYWTDINGKVVGWKDSSGTAYGVTSGDNITNIITKTAFEKAFGGGVTGGNVVTSAAELVTVLNNSSYWGMTMCNALIADLAKENAAGTYYDSSNPPVITAELAPGNNGYFPVSTFEEVAYYGNPNEGTALQFLGGYNSANVRFIVDGVNSELYITREPDKTSFSQAVLTAQDSGASLTITAAMKGAGYDDVQFVFKRMGEDAKGMLAPDRRDGYVEYDPGQSYAYAQATFKDATTGLSIANSAFFITSTERGSVYNDVDVLMRIDEFAEGIDPVTVTFDTKTNQMRISINSTSAGTVTTNDIIQAINRAKIPFQAELSFSEDPLNNGTGKFDTTGLSGRYMSIGNTGNTGGHEGTVTVWLADPNTGIGAPGEPGSYQSPTQEDIVRLINNDAKVGTMFTAKAYNSVLNSDGKQIDFVKDGPIVSSGGLVEKGIVVVHLATDKVGNVTTTAADLVKYWSKVGIENPSLVDNISVSLVRPQGAVWDECGDPYGYGLLEPSVTTGECGEFIVNDIQFVGWNDNSEQQHFVAKYSSGIMTSQRGINSSYQLVAKNLGPEWDGWTIEYINDSTLTGRFSDNLVDGADMNPCNNDPYSGLMRDACGNLISPDSTVEKGMSLVWDEANKKMVVYLKFGVTTAHDIKQLINTDPRTRNKFQINLLGDGSGSGLVDSNDDTLMTSGGVKPPGDLNGAKLLFGSDATDYFLIFRSREYGSDQFVDVQATRTDGKDSTFAVTNAAGKVVERASGKDADVLVNGIRAISSGLDISLNTAALSLNFTLSETAGTTAGFETGFTITGGGATFQVGPDVVSRQQITLGIRSINTVMLGGSTGVLNQIRSGQDADLWTNTNKAFRIVEESLLAITSIRGRLGTMQKATLETNITVLNDTLQALTEAESQIRDTDFAEETSNMTRAQILVQANMNTLGIANQIPNYMLSLLGR
jgi:flagellin-like hook-associated protein FlgL